MSGARLLTGAAQQMVIALPGKVVALALTLGCATWLVPEAFGDFALALAVVGLLDLATNPGVSVFLIKEADASPAHFSTAMSMGIVRGVVLLLLVKILAATDPFHFPEDTLRWLELMAWASIPLATRNPCIALAHQRLAFHKVALVEHGGTLVGSTLGLLLVMTTHDASGLVASYIAGAIVSWGLSWLVIKERPGVRFDRDAWFQIWKFSRFIYANTLLIFALLKLDDLAIGYVAGTRELGLYAMAFNLTNATLMFVVATGNSVLLPGFGRVRNESHAAARLFERSMASVLALVSLLAVTFAACVEPGFRFLSKDEWIPTVPLLQLLTVFVLIRAVNGVLSSLLIAYEKPHVGTTVSLLQLVLLLPTVVFGYRLSGLPGVVLGITALNLLSSLVLWKAVRLIVPARVLGVAREICPMVPPVGMALLAAVVGLSLPISSWMQIGVVVVVCAAASTYLLRVVRRTLRNES